MGNWIDLRREVEAAGNQYDIVRRKYLAELADVTGRNAIVYYSGWLQKGSAGRVPAVEMSVNDLDMSAFMATVHKLDRTRGLDLLLHTPGGSVAATESLVAYLHAMFDRDIRVFVPQIAMSAGTMIALSSRVIVMAEHSNLGPIDPQIFGMPAHGLVEEFARAKAEVAANPANAVLWQPIIAKYAPALLGEAEKAIQWAEDMVRQWLESTMFEDSENPGDLARRVVSELGDHALTKSHSRHIGVAQAEALNLRITRLESDQALQDAVLSVHHLTMQTLQVTAAFKIVENQLGVSHIGADDSFGAF
jgi:membrane-bound ClpP family serine protease